MDRTVLQINANGRPAAEPTGTYLVLPGEVEHGSDGEVAQKDESMDEANYSEVEGEEPDGGSDYETSRSTKSPPKKRTKVAASTSSKGRRKKCLSLLVTMPLDVLFEIFSHLLPRDIIHLSRASKIFRDTLMTRNATTIWKSARERVQAPDCPDWMSEPAWASLLFGHTCQSCGAGNIQAVEFLLLRRVCVSCKRKHYVPQTRFAKEYPNVDIEILDLIPGTNQSWIRTYAGRMHKYYWDSDIALVVKNLSSLGQDLVKGLPDAQILLHDYKEERKNRVQEIKQKHEEWGRWLMRFQSARYSEATKAMDRRLQQIREKFRELGYIDADLSSLKCKQECRQQAQLTERIWKRIRPLLEPGVQEDKRNRLERQMRALRTERRQILHTRYLEYQRSLSPSQWKYLPTALEISHYEPFAQFTEADTNVDVTTSMFDDLFERFPEHHAAAMKLRSASLLPLLPNCVDGKEEGEVSETVLELATAAFQCRTTNAPHHFPFVFGWNDIATHHCIIERSRWSYFLTNSAPIDGPSTPQLEYSAHAAKVVEKLVRLSGLDPMNATASDLDKKNLRFYCVDCGTTKDAKYIWRLGYTWRAMVEHLGEGAHNPTLEIVVLSSTQATEIMRCENDSQCNRNYWTCAHCPEHLGNLQKRGAVLQHLQETHGIFVPSEPNDLFFLEPYKLALTIKPKFCVGFRPENLGNQDLSSMVRCLLCTKGKQSQRPFKLPGVKDHLRMKHAINVADKGVHYSAY